MRAFRWVAVAIAVLAMIDPEFAVTGADRPVVAVVAAQRDAGDEIADALGSDFVVVRSPFSGADAVVVAGSSVPDAAMTFAKSAFAVARDTTNDVWIEDVRHPRVASVNERAPVFVQLGGNVRNDTQVELHSGTLVTDRAAVTVGVDGRAEARLVFVPAVTGTARLDVVVRRGNQRAASADVVVDVRERQWSVLFADQRPSWTSTFVRRTIERDPRFAVSSRITTSRGVSTESGSPPSLDDRALIDAFDVIVVGAPGALAARDANALEAWLRRRGGTVVLLMDEPARGDAPLARLTRVRTWNAAGCTGSAGCPIPIESEDIDGVLRGATFAVPAALPPVAQLVARDSASARPIIWNVPVGAGMVIVSGATDAWHARDPELSGFATFWPSLLAEAAASAVAPIELRASAQVVAPGERISVIATLRDALASGTDVQAPTASLEGEAIRFEATGPPGEFRAVVRAPDAPGSYSLLASAGGAQSRLAIVVDSQPSHATPDHRAALAAWTSSRGGRAFEAGNVGELRAALLDALAPERRPQPWRPMRSAWWILPFALLLGTEWWIRRRRGMA